MKRALFIFILSCMVLAGKSQVLYTAYVAKWTPTTAKDTSFKTNLVFDGDYLLGITVTYTNVDSAYISFKWNNDNVSSKYVYAPMFSSGSWVDSLFINGSGTKAIVITTTPFPYMKLDYNQVGNTKPDYFECLRSKTKK